MISVARRDWPNRKRLLAICLAVACTLTVGPMVRAETVTIENGSGAGYLLRQGGNCYVILPTHVHGSSLDDVRVGTELSGGAIGTARIVYIAPNDKDISVGVVRGGLARQCGQDWRMLPTNLRDQLVPGTGLILQRPRQSVFEGRQLVVHSSGAEMIRVVPAEGERADLFGGTSGAVVFADTTPVAMVLTADDAGAALAMRMDAIAGLVGQFLRDGSTGVLEQRAENLRPGPDVSEGDPLAAVSWTAHPIDGSVDPTGLIAGRGPWIFPMDDTPVQLTLRLTETDRMSRLRLFSQPGTDHGVPRGLSITTDRSRDPDRPLQSPLPSPEMTPDGTLELAFGERFAHTLTITFHGVWGDATTIRLDSIVID